MTDRADPELLALYLPLFFDEDVSAIVVQHLRQRGFDVLSVREAHRLHLNDSSQLAFAVSQKRTIVTHNRNDFEELHKQYLAEQQQHFGIIILKRRPNDALMVQKLLIMLNQTTMDEMINQLRYL